MEENKDEDIDFGFEEEEEPVDEVVEEVIDADVGTLKHTLLQKAHDLRIKARQRNKPTE